MIGDRHTAALVAREGSIDWLCLPSFDSAAYFAALLGTNEHGRWLIAPTCDIKSIRRRYREGTLILETTFETEGGAVTVVVDCMSPTTAAADILRLVVGERGKSHEMELVIRFDYGVRRTDDGLSAIAGPDTRLGNGRVLLGRLRSIILQPDQPRNRSIVIERF